MAKPVNTQALEKRLSNAEITFEKNIENIISAHNSLEQRVNSVSQSLDSEVKKTRILAAATLGIFLALLYSIV